MATEKEPKDRKPRESTIQVKLASDVMVSFPGTSIRVRVPAGCLVRVNASDMRDVK